MSAAKETLNVMSTIGGEAWGGFKSGIPPIGVLLGPINMARRAYLEEQNRVKILAIRNARYLAW